MGLPSIENLRCFEAAAQLGSFRSAARAVALTPAAVGQRIRQLEDQLGARLFERTTRSLALTRAGLALLPQARAALAAVEHCARVAADGGAPVPMDFVLGTRHELGLSFLLPLRHAIAAAQPGLTMHFYFGSGPDLLNRLRSREVDAAVTSSRLTDSALEGLRVHAERYVLVAAPGLLAKRPLRRPDDAASHVLVDVDAETPLFRYWRDTPAAPELHFARLSRMGTIEAIRQVVLAREGVAVLPRYLVERDLRAKRLVQLFPRTPLLADHFRLVIRADDPRRVIHERIAQVLREAALR
jgi:DNA-binding transcriptional LysR family regulator